MSGEVTRDIASRWQEAVEATEAGQLQRACQLFWDIRHFSAKIWFNLASVYMILGEYIKADESLQECLKKDGYMAVAYFQRGINAGVQGRLLLAKEMFSRANQLVPESDVINYNQLGLTARLSRHQITHNQEAVETRLRTGPKTTPVKMNELKTLSESIALFRPPRSLVDNLQKKQFLQTSKVVSSIPAVTLQEKKMHLVSQTVSRSAPTSPSPRHRPPPPPPPHRATSNPPPPSRPPPRLCASSATPTLRHRTTAVDGDHTSLSVTRR